MIDRDRLRQALGAEAAHFTLDVRAQCTSTNAELMVAAPAPDARVPVLVCDHQTAGRGRRARAWHAWPGASLTFSARWRFAPGAAVPAGLSLVAGLAAARALEALEVPGIELKWPNDLQIHGRKVGGILVELCRCGAHLEAVIGIGINRCLPDGATVPDRPDVIALADVMEVPPTAEALLARLLVAQRELYETYAQAGFGAFVHAWNQRNAFADLPVALIGEQAAVTGTCLGVDSDGALRILTDTGEQRILAGDISLRPAQ
ncbi:biotin--[acetyl-CoA-carboxylase] ligase [Nitrogeniibacter mangrovi]|uniref:biotin--[biotin carboxyl-carrier protein] ligase n=1 Tax=Nitrogeniibacter mangrovi TaxID=2016596 RepID=A0A6C1B9E1_9RHOO|nr:biotin--[acetyl-CoA-carboxylase] ligase [Nitrogeniibacter mangrovi]QID18864.1 biotin--[acetyl-CoA-carboxylase] ligase [Nitrogeniibacter mangrovi]